MAPRIGAQNTVYQPDSGIFKPQARTHGVSGTPLKPLGEQSLKSKNIYERSQMSIAGLGLSIVGLGLREQQRPELREDTIVDTSKLEYQFLNFDKDQPPSNEIVETLFEDSLSSRAFSADAVRNLRSMSLARKWKLICQDHHQPINMPNVEYDAEWFTTRIKHIGSKELHKLERLLRSRDFVEEFISLDGHMRLTDVVPDQHDAERESLVIHCFKNIINLPRGSDIVAQDFDLVFFLVKTLIHSSKINNKKTLTDVLVLISYWSPPLGRNNILKAISKLSKVILFDTWISLLDNVLKDDYVIFTSMVLKELFLSSMFLIVSIIEGAESLNDKKIIHFKLKEAGLYPILHKMRLTEDKLIDEQIERYKMIEQATLSKDIMAELNLSDSQFDLMTKTIKARTSGNDELFQVVCKIQQQFVEILETNSLSQSSKILTFIDALISQAKKSSTLSDGGDSVLHISIQKLMDQMTTHELAKRAMDEAHMYEQKTHKLQAEVKTLKESLNISCVDLFQRNDELQARLEQKHLEVSELKKAMEQMNMTRATEMYKYSKDTATISFTKQPMNPVRPSKNYVEDSQNLLRSLQRAHAGSTSIGVTKMAGSKGAPHHVSKSTISLNLAQMLGTQGSQSSWEQIEDDVLHQPTFDGATHFSSAAHVATLDEQRNSSGPYSIPHNNASSSSLESIVTSSSSHTTGGMAPVISYSTGAFERRPSNLSASSYRSEYNGGTVKTSGAGSEAMGLGAGSNSSVNGSAVSLDRSLLKETVVAGGYAIQDSALSKIYGSTALSTGSSSKLGSSAPSQSPIALPVIPGSPMEYVKLPKRDGSNSLITTGASQALPPPPPLPEFLVKNMASTCDAFTGISGSIPLPPPPPSLPGFLQGAGKHVSQSSLSKAQAYLSDTAGEGPVVPKQEFSAPPPPPPPPAMPAFMSKSTPDLHNNKGFAPIPPPPPPPIPGFMSKSAPELVKEEYSGTVPPPPPPPPPSLVASTEMAKPVVKTEPAKIDQLSRALHRPSRKLKQLHWDKINDEIVEETFWSDARTYSRADELKELGILTEIEDLFTVSDSRKRSSPVTPTTKKELLSFLPRDLSQQFGINLHMFATLTEGELVSKVLKCDYDVMENISVLEFFNKDELCTIATNLLKNYAPYAADFVTGKKPEKDVTQLARADRLYVDLCVNLRHYWRSRSRALLVIKTYEKEYHDLVSKIQRVDDSVKAIKNSKALKNLFIIIREIGNFMNRKQVDGFKLASLSKLSFVKDHNQKTFLHYVEKVIRTAYPEYLTFLQELLLLQDTAKISIEQLSADINSFIQSVRNIERSVESGNLSDPKVFHPQDRFLAKVSPRLPEALRKCQLLEDQHRFIISDFEKLMKYFGENSADSTARSTFLQKFLDFVTDFKRVRTENQENEEKNKIYEKRKEMMLQSKKAKKIRIQSTGNDAGNEDDVVGNLLKRLKGVSAERRRLSTSGAQAPARARPIADGDNLLLSRAQTMLEDTKGIR